MIGAKTQRLPRTAAKTRRTCRAIFAATLQLQSPTAQAAPHDAAQPVGPCTAQQVCGFDDPEDLADLPGTRWLIVGQAKGLIAFDTGTHTRLALATSGPDPDCPANTRGGGIGVRRSGVGLRLVRILHAENGGPDAVSSYEVALVAGRPSLRRLSCVLAPALYFLNDISPLPNGGFAATHMFDRAQPKAEREAAFLAGQPTGFVVRWSKQDGWRRLPGTDGSFLNGLDLSSDGRFLAFAETYGHAVNRVRLDGSDRRRVIVPMNPDNVTALPHGRFSVVGGTGKPLVSTRTCPELRRPGCGFPASALSVDFTTGRTRELVTSSGKTTPGFSVGLIKDGSLYLGTAFGDRLTIVPATEPPAALP